MPEPVRFDAGAWRSTGLAEWSDGETVFLSIAFTWRLNDAYQRAIFHRARGLRVVAGGPGIFTRKHFLADVAELGGDYPDAIARHNPQATIASRGCPVGCWFCIVPKMEGKDFTLLPDFPVRPVLCDNNLSALPADYQDHIVARYRRAGVPLLDANSGFEPRTFTEEVFRRWAEINRGPWRFAYDDAPEGIFVEPVMRMLRQAGVSPRKIQVYTLIGNEPFDECMTRIDQVMRWGGEPYAQPYMKLNALEKRPHVRFDWTEGRLLDVQRWCNYSRRAGVAWADYSRSARTSRRDTSGMLPGFGNG
jgi:hypothetical protein